MIFCFAIKIIDFFSYFSYAAIRQPIKYYLLKIYIDSELTFSQIILSIHFISQIITYSLIPV